MKLVLKVTEKNMLEMKSTKVQTLGAYASLAYYGNARAWKIGHA